MDLDRPRRLQYAALRVVSDAREELSSVTHDQISQGVDLLDALSRAILGVAQHFQYGDDARNHCYLRLISALAKNDEWCKRLTRDNISSGAMIYLTMFLNPHLTTTNPSSL